MMYLKFFELLPVILACFAIIANGLQIQKVRRHKDKIVSSVAIICCILLIVAQSSWYVSVFIEQDLAGTWFANNIWTLFNSFTMICFMLIGWNRMKK